MIVGLGNPGKEYQTTKHNIGFMMIDYLAHKYGVDFTHSKLDGDIAMVILNKEKILLLKPQLYINLSGDVIYKFMNYYKLKSEDILIIHDDLDMSFGKTRIVYNSSSGGHNGIKNIESVLGIRTYTRLKIGISRCKDIDEKNYVLSKLSNNEQTIIENVCSKIDNIVEDFLLLSREQLMNKYNKA